MNLLPNITATEVESDVAVLPVGSFEQHGAHLPLATDTIVATAIAEAITGAHHLWQLSPLSFSCSHEHASFPGTLSISATTLHAVIADLSADVERQGGKLIIVNGHGGNSVLVNAVQEANVSRRRLLLYPTSADWAAARQLAGCLSTVHQDMHAGEAETSILLHVAPDYLRDGWRDDDHEADDRSLLTLVGMQGYTTSGVIGLPSQATVEKGRLLLDALASRIGPALDELRKP